MERMYYYYYYYYYYYEGKDVILLKHSYNENENVHPAIVFDLPAANQNVGEMKHSRTKTQMNKMAELALRKKDMEYPNTT